MSTNLNPGDVWAKYMNFPLSGATTISQQFMHDMGFININIVNTGDDPKIEKEIIDDVAGYGRQLGWIIEVLNIITDRYDLKDLTGKEYASMDRFFDLIKKIENIKQKNRQCEGVKQKPEDNMLTPGELNLMIEGVRAWKKIDDKKYEEMVSRIKSAFP
ncbi:MAG: hypothetical protein C3F06_03395 [Candidatus Methanoperedenaceae archaeon]|nr:MAG: hypothetical protein C3F06_03395 [Candidatus Methanoperedenaceae archaeon]